MRSPLQYYGGKGHFVKHLIEHAPRDYSTYVEPYFGGGSLFFALPPARHEIINDINSELMHFFQVFQNKTFFRHFHTLIKFTPHARSVHDECKRRHDADPVLRAWCFYILTRQSFAGKFAASWCYNVRPRGFVIKRNLATVRRMPQAHERLQNAKILNISALSIIQNTDPTYWVYLDPPYVHDTRVSKSDYCIETTDTHHHLLVDILLRIECMVLLSGYIHPIYKPLENAGWRRVDIPIACYSAGTTSYNKRTGERVITEKRSKRIESLWLNYDPKTSRLIV